MKCLFLTGTIRPLTANNVAITNPDIRESQYYESIKYYIRLGIPIVFCENSASVSEKISSLFLNRNNCEYLSFQSSESIFGKSHGEKEIIDFAFKNSSILNKANWIIKISGRYLIKNIKDILVKLDNYNIDVMANFSHNLTWCDSKIILFKKEFYFHYFKPHLEKYLDDKNKICFEKVLAMSVHRLLSEGGRYYPWVTYPFYEGFCGGSGKVYHFSFLRRIKFQFYVSLKNWVYRQHI